jgi:hypothetical protein
MKRKGFMKGVSSKFNVCIRTDCFLVQIATDEKGRIQLMIWRCVQMFRKSKVVESGYRKFNSEISDLEGYRKDFTICLVLQ